MACFHCKDIEHSYNEKPFYPPGGYRAGKELTYRCSDCGQGWFCYNDYHCLWGKVKDELTWKFLINKVDVPISIGSVCAIMPGYEEHAIDPAHKICHDRVHWPIIRIEPAEGEREETAVLQWFGEYDRGNIFNYQFAFPIMLPLEKYQNSIDSFKVPFVGKIRDWPHKQKESIAKSFNNPEMDKDIVYLLSSEYSQNYSDGSTGPVSLLSGLVLLGDPNVGVIRPRYFFDISVSEYVMEEFTKKSQV